jgi:pyruvate-formate lyase-activating enzyme
MTDPRTVDDYIRDGGLRAALPAKHVAGLILTYRCSIACRHCLFCCSPDLPGAVMTVQQAVETILDFHELGRVVHVAGGEAMLYPDVVLEATRRAGEAGKPPHFVETNAFWAVDDELTEHRLRELKDAGLVGLLISTDLYHQEFVPADNFLRCRRIAREVFGPDNVLASDADEQVVRDFERHAGDPEHIAAQVRGGAPRLVGRSAKEFAQYMPLRPIEELALDPTWHGPNDGMACAQQYDPDSMWEVHVDPYGNIQTCCGVLLGHVKNGPVHEQAKRGWLRNNPIAATLSDEGPVGLLPLARKHGYKPRDAYPQKCFLCYEMRYLLREHYPDLLGPAEVYSEPPPELGGTTP